MKSSVIANVRTPKMENGDTLYVLDLIDGYSLVRSEVQFKADCSGSFATTSAVAPSALIGGQVGGDFEFHKAGSTYIADENSGVVIRGEANVGDEITREKDGSYVNGFLTLQKNLQAQIADSAAAQVLAQAGLLSAPVSAPTAQIEEGQAEEAPKAPEAGAKKATKKGTQVA